MDKPDASDIVFKRRRVAGIIAAVLWIACLVLPALTFCGEMPMRGWDVLLIGAIGVAKGEFGWFANLYMLGMIACLITGRRVGISAGVIVLLFALSSFAFNSIMAVTDNGSQPVCQFGVGFYVWIACAVFLFVVAIVDQWLQRRGANADI
jgi:hypothetical protein